MPPTPSASPQWGGERLLTTAAARLLACVLAAALWTASATAGEAPALADVWRQLLARPAATPHPADNPSSACRVALGAALFQDRRLSRGGDRSCASCHEPDRGFTDGRVTAAAHDGSALTRNTPSLLDVAFATSLHWDGQIGSLEEQAWLPIAAPDEMAGQWPRIAALLDADGELRAAFAAAFPASPAISAENIAKAIAAYERTLVSPPSRLDRWVEGDDSALDAEELAGLALFVGKAGCVGCHSGWRFTDGRLHDIGLATRAGQAPRAMRTPALRGVARTAPYMHDGSKPTLIDVIDHYAGGFARRPTLAGNLVRGLTLEPTEKRRLVAFLEALSPEPSTPALPSIRQHCLSSGPAGG
jgi:cytochrome c peroxidase